MTVGDKNKTVFFFEIQALTDGCRKRSQVVDWESFLTRHLEIPTQDRKIETKTEDLLVFGIQTNPTQAKLGRLIDGDTGIQHGSWSKETVEPVQAVDPDDFFIRTTYIQFINKTNVVGVVGGQGDSPSKSRAEAFLNKIYPQPSQWVLEPIVVPGQLSEFKTNNKAGRVKFSCDVEQPDLLHVNDTNSDNSLEKMVQQIVTVVDGPISITCEIKVRRPKDNPNSLYHLFSMVSNSENLISSAKKMQVSVKDQEMGEEVLNLIEHKITAQIPLYSTHEEGMQEQIISKLAEVCETNAVALKELTRPAD